MLDKNGFTRPTYNELVEQEAEKWVQLFGENAQTNSHSVGGVIIRIHAYFLNKLYQLAEIIYNSQFVDSAAGTTLDHLGADIGLNRLPSQAAMGTVEFTGKSGYIVPQNSLVRTPDGLEYITSEDIKLDEKGHGISHLLYATAIGSKYNKTDSTSAIMVVANENIRNVTVSNISGGADEETDDKFRERINWSNRTMMPSSPYNGVISAIKKVTGVKAVKIIPNDTLVDDKETNTPAKSIHIFVDGGYKDDIGEAIFNSVAAGVLTVGKQEVQLTDVAGSTHKVYFDNPATKALYVVIKLIKTIDYPIDGDDRIKKICIDYVNSVGMGNTVYYSYLYQKIYDQVPGIKVADIKIGLSKDNVSAQDINMSNVEIASITSDKVLIS